jgi:hypothetical protein
MWAFESWPRSNEIKPGMWLIDVSLINKPRLTLNEYGDVGNRLSILKVDGADDSILAYSYPSIKIKGTQLEFRGATIRKEDKKEFEMAVATLFGSSKNAKLIKLCDVIEEMDRVYKK